VCRIGSAPHRLGVAARLRPGRLARLPGELLLVLCALVYW
jgi:hypothetical protein